jgi:filamentous hemagglutinin family protein
MVCPHHIPDLPSRLLRLLLVGSGVLLSALLGSSPAQVQTALTPDGTLGTAISPRGTLFDITGGTRQGPNLFHSFDRFSVGTGHTANFTSEQTGIKNILSRVTGGQRSDIDGILRTDGQLRAEGAHLYLLNPAGVVFGANAHLDVTGSFHVSTADYLRLADGARFVARLSDTSTLSVAPPVAFGFLGPTLAAITVQGSTLEVPEGQTLSVIGGDAQIMGGTLRAPSGRIQLASVAAAGEVRPGTAGQALELQVDSFARLGRLEISQKALIDASGNGGGTVLIRGGRLLVDSSNIFADNTGEKDGAGLGIDLRIAADALIANRAFITTDSLGAGRAKDVRLQVGTLTLTGGAQISSSTTGVGDGGTVAVGTGQLIMQEGAGLRTVTSGGGTAGTIAVTAERITVTSGAQIASSTVGPGQGGAVTVTATDTLMLAGTSLDGTVSSAIGANAQGASTGAGNAGSVVVAAPRVTLIAGGQIASVTTGPGQGGAVTVTATDTLTLTGTNPAGTSSSGIFASALGQATGAGNAGSIVVQTPCVALTEGALIDSSTLGPGQGGAVTVTATDTLTLTGTRPNGTAASGLSATAQGTSAGAGNAGSIVVQAPRVALTEGAQINTITSGPGQGGAVTVTAMDTLTLMGTDPTGTFRSGIVANAQGSGMRAGNAGSIVVAAPRVALAGGAQITSSTSGPGQGGTVTVTATDTLTLTGTGPTDTNGSAITASTTGPGQGGSVTISVGTLEMDGGSINASAGEKSLQGAGAVTVIARRATLTGGAIIDSSTLGAGPGGSVTVNASEALTIAGRGNDVSGLQSSSSGSGAAGTVTVEAGQLTLQEGGVISSSTFGAGPGGLVAINAGLLEMDGGKIGASAFAQSMGAAGTVTVTAERITLERGAQIVSSTEGSGAGGSVRVTATDTLTLTGTSPDGTDSSGIFANALGTEAGAGNAGSVVAEAPHVRLTAGAQISSTTVGPGQGGSVRVTATDTLTLAGSHIQADTLGTETGAGNAGSVVVEAPHVLLTEGTRIDSSTIGLGQGGTVRVTATDTLTLAGSRIQANALGTEAGAGNAGSVVVEAPRVALSGGAQIDSSTFGPGQGGALTVAVQDMMTLVGQDSEGFPSGLFTSSNPGSSGNAGTLQVEVGKLVVTEGAGIASSTRGGSGHGGTVTVIATDSILISGRGRAEPSALNPGESALSSRTLGSGNAGRVMVSTPRLTLDNGGRLEATTGGDGRGGDVVVVVESLTLSGGAQISSSSGFDVGNQRLVGAGQGGTITVTAADTVAISGRNSGLSTSTIGPGQGGELALQTRQIQLTDGAVIAAESTGTGNAGSLTLMARDTVLLRGHSAVTTAASEATGGNIRITASSLIRLQNSQITATVGGGTGDGGNVTIDPEFIVLQGSQITANAVAGHGGRINLTASKAFLADPSSVITASSTLGINGTVAIEAPVTSISGAVAPLPQAFAQPAELLRSRCAERLREGAVSRFVVGGRDGVPLEPGSLLLSPLEQTRVEQEEGQGSPASEAQPGWIVSAQAHTLRGWEVECARWVDKPGTPKRRR